MSNIAKIGKLFSVTKTRCSIQFRPLRLYSNIIYNKEQLRWNKADGNRERRVSMHVIGRKTYLSYTGSSQIPSPPSSVGNRPHPLGLFFSHNRKVACHNKQPSSSSIQINNLRFISSCKLYPPEMSSKIISGREVADEIRASLKDKVKNLGFKPKLAIVQVGGREDSNVYIRMKVQFAESIGATTEVIKLSKETTEDELAERVQELNKNSDINGIITQLPFDSVSPINSDRIVNLIDPSKDVDGLTVYNAGMLLHGQITGSSFVACTPSGCLELIKKSGVKIPGSRSVVFGRSKIVGSPMAQLLLWNNSTVTICHSRTKDPERVCREADIVVVAVGQPLMVKKDWLKPGAVVIDCGINAIPDATKKSGSRLVGDVDFEDCKEIAGAITPVPGGVGPMTVAMLLANTVEAAIRQSTK